MQQPAEKRLPLPMSPQLAAETGSAAVSIAARWQEELRVLEAQLAECFRQALLLSLQDHHVTGAEAQRREPT